MMHSQPPMPCLGIDHQSQLRSPILQRPVHAVTCEGHCNLPTVPAAMLLYMIMSFLTPNAASRARTSMRTVLRG